MILSGWRKINFPYENYMDKQKCIFIHIPKTAGTSVLNALGKEKGGRNHLPWYVYYTANQYKFNNYFKFAFVRNPWDRVYSAYSYLLEGGNKQGDMNLLNIVNKYNNFENFVVHGLGCGDFRNHLLFIPQSEFIVGPQGEIVVDFVGNYEKLEDDFHKLMSIMGKSNKKLPQLNKSLGNQKYKDEYLTQKSIDVVEQIYRQDIKTFNYSFNHKSP
jgi:hypothetical protein